MNDSAIDREMRRRSREQLGRTHLYVDYYRIRRRLAHPLPLKRRPIHDTMIRGVGQYPWDIWLMWELEERVGALGWAGEWFGDADCRAAAAVDLEAIAGWKAFVPPEWHGLSVGHYLRLLWTARTRWSWLEEGPRQKIDDALERAVAVSGEWLEKTYGMVIAPDATAEALVAGPDAGMLIHNIKVIALLGWAIAANTIRSADAKRLNLAVRRLVDVLELLRRQGVTEGAAYDGYLLDFIACWMESLEAEEREQIVSRGWWSGFLDETLYLSAPGDVMAVAELSDVEPVEMPFHVTPQVRFERWKPEPRRAWYLKRWGVDRLRVDALANLRGMAEGPASEPEAGVLDAFYARVLRSGWKGTDVAVAIAASNSSHGHIHKDYGSLCIGTGGRWVLTDPGYQQYRDTSERMFTMGPDAHNVPRVNGHAMDRKNGRVIESREEGRNPWKVEMELSGCFGEEAQILKAMRTVWLIGRKAVVVADQFAAKGGGTLKYNWHFHPDAAFDVDEGSGGEGLGYTAAMVYLPPEKLWIASPQGPKLTRGDFDRQRGSRGHQTLGVSVEAGGVVWWVFNFGESFAPFEMEADGKGIKVAGKRLRVSESKEGHESGAR